MHARNLWILFCLLALPLPVQAVEARRTGHDGWWLSFDDDALSSLVERALAHNDDLAAASQREQAAQAVADQGRAPLLPSLSLEARAGASPSESLGFQMGGLPALPGEAGPTLPDVVYDSSALVQLRYQVNLGGQQALAWRSLRHQAEASEHDVSTTSLLISLQVAEAYFDALAAQQRIFLTQRQVETQRELLELLELRFDQGAASASEVWQQRQQVASTEANLPEAEAAQRQAWQQLALLLALPAGSLDDFPELQPTALSLPAPPTLPERWSAVQPGPGQGPEPWRGHVAQRPDLQAARERLAAAREQRRSSYRAFAPTVGLSVYGGGQAFRSDDWSTQSTWGASVDLSVPLFRGLSDVASVREARAREAEARESLEQASRQAQADVVRALEAEQEARDQLEARRRVETASQGAFEAAQASFSAGVGSYLSVMTALAALQQAEQAVLLSLRQLLRGRTRLHQALGGAWPRDGQSREER
jgi:outer membrane protein TolC